MRRVELLDSRVSDNLEKTDSVITKLRSLDTRLFQQLPQRENAEISDANEEGMDSSGSNINLDDKLVNLDRKVSDISTRLASLKTQLDSNLLPLDDINAEASEKKPVSMNVLDATRAMNTELMNHVTKEIGGLRAAADGVDRKLQFHVNLVSENLAKVLHLVTEVHESVVTDNLPVFNRNGNANVTNIGNSKQAATSRSDDQVTMADRIGHRMDEVLDLVVDTKTTLDNLVPRTGELLTQTLRQERAIGQVHQDLRAKANQIISNLDMVERRLRKQEQQHAANSLPVPAELLLDPTIDRLVEYGQTTFDDHDYTIAGTTESPQSTVTLQTSSTQHHSTSSSANLNSATSGNTAANSTSNNASSATSSKANIPRKGGIIFPSVKNKPTLVNSTFAAAASADSINYRDVKGYSCVDLLNAGMKDSGVYYLQIRGTTYWFLKVFCEQQISDGGWTVIQRRDDFGGSGEGSRENFNRDWADYKNGFGDPAKEFWLGNENIYMLTNNEDYALRVELEDFEGNKRYAQYSHFKIYSEAEYYKLEIDGYEGNAGDSLNDPWYGSNNSPFSTYNRDNDRSSLNCASMLKGGWWWKSCGRGLNGLYLHDPQDLTARQGIVWFRWRGWDYTLKRATMMIRPRGASSASFASASSTSSTSNATVNTGSAANQLGSR
ncbi:angiopoietin-1-like [Ctenocephalides felis]|uniref:angiopoietin-1-like n=1 Tax=Ctenocephalides felis TaxID=7515 RepID=UPI000E6E22F6|nr:angiopoietin-1-like [Ctenocephalides felis]